MDFVYEKGQGPVHFKQALAKISSQRPLKQERSNRILIDTRQVSTVQTAQVQPSTAQTSAAPYSFDAASLRCLLSVGDVVRIKTLIPKTKIYETAAAYPRRLLCAFSPHLTLKLCDPCTKELFIDNPLVTRSTVCNVTKWMEHFCRGYLSPTDAGPYDFHSRFAFWFLARSWRVDALISRLSFQLTTDLKMVTLETASAALVEARIFKLADAMQIINVALFRLVNFWTTDVNELNMLQRHGVSSRILNRAVQRFMLLHINLYPEVSNVPMFDRLHWSVSERLVSAYEKHSPSVKGVSPRKIVRKSPRKPYKRSTPKASTKASRIQLWSNESP